MTRTQKLSLFTWQLSDPVDLSQMNENFDRLDQNGCRTEAALWNSAIGLLAAEHAGFATCHSESACANALHDPARLDSYENLGFGENGAVLLTQGAANHSQNLDRPELSGNALTLLSDYRPEGYATLTGIRLEGSGTNYSGVTAHLYLYCEGEQIAQASQTLGSASPFSVDFSFQQRLDPNKTYSVTASGAVYGSVVVQLTKVTLLTSSLTYTTGSLQTGAFSVPAGAARLRLMCTTTGTAPTVQLATAGGGWSALTLSSQTVGTLRYHTGQLTLPTGLQTVRLKFSLSGAGNRLRDYAFILF